MPFFTGLQEKTLRWHWLVGTSAGIFLQGCGYLLAFGSGILSARALGSSAFGHFTYVLSIVGVASTLALLGLPEVTTRFMAVFHASQQWGLGRGLIRFTQTVCILSAILLMVVLGLIGLVLKNSELRLTLWVASPILIMAVIVNLRQQTLQGLHHPIAAQIPEQIIKYVVFLTVGGTLWIAGSAYVRQPAGLMSLWVLSTLVSLMVGIVLLRRFLPFSMNTAKPEYARTYWIKTAMPMWIANGVGVIYGTVDTIILGFFRPFAAVGLYQVALRAAGTITIVVASSNWVLAPWFSRLFSLHDRARLQALVTRVTRGVFLLTLCFFAVLALGGREILQLFFGVAYVRAFEPLLILGSSRIVTIAIGPVIALQLMTGGQKIVAWVTALGLLMNTLGCVLIIPKLGIRGAALSTGLSMIVTQEILAVYLKRRIGLKPGVFGHYGLVRKS